MFNIWRQSLCLIFVFVLLGSAMAEPLDAAASDPNVMGWMHGFPPADDRIIGYPASDYFSFPKLRWTFATSGKYRQRSASGGDWAPSPRSPRRWILRLMT